MKRLIIILFLISNIAAFSQNLTLFDVDTTDFPVMRAKFYAFDENGKQILNLSPADFSLTENGIEREIIGISCPKPKEPVAISSVLTIDVSGSMGGKNIENAKEAAKAWINGLPLGKSECAITSFANSNSYIQDFTTDRTKLLSKINSIITGGGTDFNAGFINPMAGGILASQNGKYKRVIVFLSDGYPNNEPETQKIINEAQKYSITVFSVTLDQQCPDCLKLISEETGGKWFENVTSKEAAVGIYNNILKVIQDSKPCQIEWNTSGCDNDREVKLILKRSNLISNSLKFNIVNDLLPKIEYLPNNVISFGQVEKGSKKINEIILKAYNKEINIEDIEINNSMFSITDYGGENPPFIIRIGEERKINIEFYQESDGYEICEFNIFSNSCQNNKFYAVGYTISNDQSKNELELIHPNGDEIFIAGTDTSINWKGGLPNDIHKLYFSYDNGINWVKTTDDASNFEFNWKIPKIKSKLCLIRIGDESKEPLSNPIVCNKWYRDIDGNTNSISWNPNNKHLSSSHVNKRIYIWRVNSGDSIDFPRFLDGASNSVMWSNSGKYLAGISNSGNIRIFEFNEDEEKLTSTVNLDSLDFNVATSFIWSKDDTRFIVSGYNKTDNLIVYDYINKSKIMSTKIDGNPRNIEWLEDHGLIITSIDSVIYILNDNDLKISHILKGHSGYISDLFVTDDRTRLITTSTDSTVRIWDLSTYTLIDYYEKNKRMLNMAYNPDRQLLAYSEYALNKYIVRIIDFSTKKLLRSLSYDSPTSSILDIKWNSIGNTIAYGTTSGKVFIHTLASDNLSDISDTVFSIVMPEADALDIDMGKALVDTYKDSVVTAFLTNPGSWKNRIDSIVFEGQNAASFRLLSGIPPYYLDPGVSKAVEFSFHPTSEGIKNAEILIYTQADTLRRSITGEGVDLKLDVFSGIVDFGLHELYEIQDTTIVLLENKSNDPITFTATEMLGPDKMQFEIIEGGGAFSLNSGETRELKLRFLPKYIGRTSGQIGFYYDNVGSPAIAQLFGAGIGGAIYAGHDSAYAGEFSNINISLNINNPEKFKQIVSSVSGIIRMEKTILYPSDLSMIYRQSDDSTYVYFESDLTGTNSILAEIECIAGLGRVAETSIDFEEIHWYDENGVEIEYDTEMTSGSFKLLGICPEGGARLINPLTKAGIMNLAPNPADNRIEIELSLIESGYTELALYNIMGEKVKTIYENSVSRNQKPEYQKKISTDISELSTGQYFVILKTPTYMESRHVVILK